jgi:hypothetical protein
VIGQKIYVSSSVADPTILSRTPDPDFYLSQIPNPTTAPKEEKEKFFCPTNFCSRKYHKIVLFLTGKEIFL